MTGPRSHRLDLAEPRESRSVWTQRPCPSPAETETYQFLRLARSILGPLTLGVPSPRAHRQYWVANTGPINLC